MNEAVMGGVEEEYFSKSPFSYTSKEDEVEEVDIGIKIYDLRDEDERVEQMERERERERT